MDFITLIVGLPGSGKTYLANQMKQEGEELIDDIKSVDQLPESGSMIITDPHLCVPSTLDNALAFLKRRYPYHIFEIVFFENDLEKALANVERRDDGRKVTAFATRLASIYNPPKDCIKIYSQNKEIQ